ncbi:MAG: efflux RND transporter periplasmic adaptor subunit [wastewater metagenome]|nr:efflux RND transporter periplasmic adaptor subunit [Candidatus Loosdrechtia aerotolerans]
MKKSIIIGIVCFLIIGAVYIYFFRSKDTIHYKTEEIGRGIISKYITATGTVNPVRTVVIGSQVSGLISQLSVDFNSKVEKGQVVAQIDPIPFEHEVKRAEAALAIAIANLEKAKVNAKNSKRSYLRLKELYENKVISIHDLDAAQTTYETNLADVELAEAQVLQAKAALEIAKTNLKHTVITSPLNGIVISKEVDVGQTVAATFQTPVLFTIAEDLVHMQVDVNVDEADIGMVEVGQTAKFTVDAFPEDVFEGVVVEIRKAPVIFQNVVTYSTIISFDNSLLKLMPGMTANTSILVAKAENVLRVPNAAFRYMPSRVLKQKAGERDMAEAKDAKTGPSIWILEQGEPKEVPVELGISDYNFTKITGGDLKEGQEVILAEIIPGSASGGAKPRVPWSRRY